MKRSYERERKEEEKERRCGVLGIRDWDRAPRRGHAAGEASRGDRCGIKKTRRGRVFLMALIPRRRRS